MKNEEKRKKRSQKIYNLFFHFLTPPCAPFAATTPASSIRSVELSAGALSPSLMILGGGTEGEEEEESAATAALLASTSTSTPSTSTGSGSLPPPSPPPSPAIPRHCPRNRVSLEPKSTLDSSKRKACPSLGYTSSSETTPRLAASFASSLAASVSLPSSLPPIAWRSHCGELEFEEFEELEEGTEPPRRLSTWLMGEISKPRSSNRAAASDPGAAGAGTHPGGFRLRELSSRAAPDRDAAQRKTCGWVVRASRAAYLGRREREKREEREERRE